MKNFNILLTKKNGETKYYENIWKIESIYGTIKFFIDNKKYSISKKDIYNIEITFND